MTVKIEELLPCHLDFDQVMHDRQVEIRTLATAARSIVEISPEAARALRDATRALIKEQDKALKAAQPLRQKKR